MRLKMEFRNTWNIMAVSSILNFFMPLSVMGACDYYQDMVLGQHYYIYNSEYPNYYSAGTSCRWVAQSPINTKIVVSCEDVRIPAAANCATDRLAVSLTGDANFQDAHNYCGTGTLSVISTANKVAVGLFATWNSPGGRFLCTITSVSSPEPPLSNCTCGWSQQRRIVGGQETGVNEFPAMAGLIDFTIRDVYCGATIISNRYAITAAHCLQNRATSNVGLLVGDHDISVGTDTDAAALYPLSHIIIHHSYNNVTQVNDIAIVKTQSQMTFSSKVGPICLPFRYSTDDFSYQSVTALGWGTIEFSGPRSDKLQAVNLTVITNTECRNRMTSNVITNEQMCTYATGKDACQYDSGGPLLWRDSSTGRLHLTGVISYGIACGGTKPGVNTRVNSYLTWIVENTPDTHYCIK